MRDPGPYDRILGKVEQIMHAGGNPDAVPFEEMQVFPAYAGGVPLLCVMTIAS